MGATYMAITGSKSLGDNFLRLLGGADPSAQVSMLMKNTLTYVFHS